MTIALTTDRARNPLISTLLCALSAESITVDSVIAAIPPPGRRFIRGVRRHGLHGVLRRLQSLPAQKDHAMFDTGVLLKQFADAHRLPDWNRRLPSLCRARGIAWIRAHDINADRVVAHISKRGIDLLINGGGGIFRRGIIGAPRIGILNAHMGPLPRYRGMNALEWCLFHRQPAGVTLHLVDRGVDTGDIVLFRKIPINRSDTIASLRAKSLVINIELILDAVRGLQTETITPTPQKRADGRQFFVMHPRLKKIAEEQLKCF